MSKLAARDQVEADMAAEREALLQVPSCNYLSDRCLFSLLPSASCVHANGVPAPVQDDSEGALGEGSQISAAQQAEEDVLQVLSCRQPYCCGCLLSLHHLGIVQVGVATPETVTLLPWHCRALWQSFLAACLGNDAAVACLFELRP